MDWFAEFGWKPGPFGQADVLARARDLSIDHLERSQVLKASEGKVWLTPLKEYPDEWLPGDQGNASVWESLHQLIKAFHRSGGVGAARLLALMQERESGMRQLAYLLYTLCERKGWAEEARAYNELIAGWQDLERIAPAGAPRRRKGMELFDQEKEQS
jgi:putative DNA methylase